MTPDEDDRLLVDAGLQPPAPLWFVAAAAALALGIAASIGRDRAPTVPPR